jgi:hypothetical protein
MWDLLLTTRRCDVFHAKTQIQPAAGRKDARRQISFATLKKISREDYAKKAQRKPQRKYSFAALLPAFGPASGLCVKPRRSPKINRILIRPKRAMNYLP